MTGVFSLISDDFLDGPTLDPLQPAQSKRYFPTLTSSSEETLKSIDFNSISETFLLNS